MQPEKIHDRRTTDLPINSMVSVAIVADPYSDKGEKIEVLRSIRDDHLAGMHSRGQIDDAQLLAGRKWELHLEGAQIGNIRAIDPTKEAVDGGGMREALTDKQIAAFAQLHEASVELGSVGNSLIRDILGERLSVAQAAARRGYNAEREINYLGRRFRECLESLARLWG